MKPRFALTKSGGAGVPPRKNQGGAAGPGLQPRGADGRWLPFKPGPQVSAVGGALGGQLLGAAGAFPSNRYGYGSYGASRRKVGLEEWHAFSGSPDQDITANLPLLRQRSRDLFMGAPIAAAAILRLRTNAVGNGLKVMPQVDAEVLGKTKEEAAALNKFLAAEFALFGNTVECDWNRRSTFGQLQDLVFVNVCISGDVLATLPMKERRGSIYATKVRLIEADRVANPWGAGAEAETAAGGPRVFGGVELDADGEVVAYWVAKRHPAGAALSGFIGANPALQPEDFERIPVYGPETGRPVALLIGEMERPEQRRAVPMMSKCLTELKNLSRYIESSTVQNVIKSYFTAFITSAMPSTEMFSGLIDDETMADFRQRDPYNVKLGPGIINWMRPGDTITFPIHAGPESEFEPYTTALVKYVGACLGIPYEVLLMQFNASYSASRASKLEFWGRVKVLRQMLVDQFCQPTYEAWLMEAVARRIVQAPGFLENPRIFRAWSRCSWSGSSPGSIDPLKEIVAADKRVKLGISTLERESLEINGSDWRENALQQGIELAFSTEQGLPYTRNQTAEDSPIPPELLNGEGEGEPLPPPEEEEPFP
jgi:lambda family phage portal protein